MANTITGYEAYKQRNDLNQYGKDSLLLFALELKFQLEDIHTIAPNVLTGKGDDKKCDLVFVDIENNYAVIGQGYIAQNESKKEAKANKASDLNTAASWLLTRSIEDIPSDLRPAARELRNAIKEKQIRYLQFWYVHNLRESSNVENELRTVENTAQAAIRSHFPHSEIAEISGIEIGINTLDEWYRSLTIPILVSDDFEVNVPGGYQLVENDWSAFTTALPAYWLHNVFKTHKSDLFSANVRGYLGSRKAEQNINHGIKDTVSTDPEHFWPYNNGLTILVKSFDYDEISKILRFTGFSIVNGAQTTGAIGSLDKTPNSDAMVSARFIKCLNPETIKKIIKFNNSQNQVEAPDFRSNDPIQKRLVKEFKDIPNATYFGGRRGGAEDIIKRQPYLIPSYTAAQALAAFHEDPIIAYNQRSNIWLSNNLYDRYFKEQTTARHIVFAYSLLGAIEEKRHELTELEVSGSIIEAQRTQLELLRYRGANFLLVTGIAYCLETFIGKPIANKFLVKFKSNVSPEKAKELWKPIVEISVSLPSSLIPAIKHGMNNKDQVMEQVKTFQNLLEATKFINTPIYEKFSLLVSLD